MILTISKFLTSRLIKYGAAEEENKEIYTYGFQIIGCTLCTSFCLLFGAYTLGIVPETIYYLCCFVLLRRCTGGYHAKKYWSCCVGTVSSCFVGIYIGKYLYLNNRLLLLIILAASVCAIFLLAPMVNENKPLKKEELPKFRIISRCMTLGLCLLIAILYITEHDYISAMMSVGIAVTASFLILGEVERRKKV